MDYSPKPANIYNHGNRSQDPQPVEIPIQIDELKESLKFQKALVENLKEVIQARDLEIKYLENTIKVKEILLQHYPDTRAFNSLFRVYQKGNRLFPPGTWRRKLMAGLASYFIR